MAKRLRSIVREWDFEEPLERLLVNTEEADDFTLGAEVALAHDPTLGRQVEGTDVWAWAMAPVRGRAVTLYYTFNGERVTFLALVAWED